MFGTQTPESASVTVREIPLHAVVVFPREFGQNGQSVFLFLRPSYVVLLNSPLPPYTMLLYLLSRIALLAVISGLCCYLLTLYLVKPVTRLGRMAEQLGEGNLRTRIAGSLATRTDELGELGRKFNQMAGEIESLVKRYKDFLAHASHELGSPLTRVNIALALARQKADPTLHPELDRIAYETNRLNALVQELLLLARLESGNELSRQTASFDVAELVEEACADANFEAARMGKPIILRNRETFRVVGHRELLRRSLDNVLRNGLRFAQEAGSVQVDMMSHPAIQEGVILIRDDGPGIGPEQAEVIFEPFVTLQDRSAGQIEGSGLGLAIARQAVLAKGKDFCQQYRFRGLNRNHKIAHRRFGIPPRKVRPYLCGITARSQCLRGFLSATRGASARTVVRLGHGFAYLGGFRQAQMLLHGFAGCQRRHLFRSA
jgi:two-component system sensor histidine kinase CpxA